MTVRRTLDGDGEPRSATLDLVRSTSTELFADRGFAATTMRQLADRAQLPLSAFYYYFRSKYDVLLAIMDAAMGNLEENIEEDDDERAPADERLVALVARHVEVHLREPAIARVADGELRSLKPADRDAIVARRDAYERRFRDALAAGVADGRFDPELEIPIAAMAILTMATSVVDWWRPEGKHTIAATSELIGRFAIGVATGSQVTAAPDGAARSTHA
jgi:AcrR family transcriptional regulator